MSTAAHRATGGAIDRVDPLRAALLPRVLAQLQTKQDVAIVVTKHCGRDS